MPLSVYLAAQFARKPELQRHAAELRRAGITVTSRWLTGAHDVPYERYLTHAEQAQYAREDLDDIDRSDVVVVFGDPPDADGQRGGKAFECGYAYAQGIQIVVVGFRDTIFHHLPELVFCPDPVSAIAYVKGLHVDGRGRVAA